MAGAGAGAISLFTFVRTFGCTVSDVVCADDAFAGIVEALCASCAASLYVAPLSCVCVCVRVRNDFPEIATNETIPKYKCNSIGMNV